MGEKNWLDVTILVVLLVFFVLGIFGLFATRRSILAKNPTLDVKLDDVTYTDQNKVTVTGQATPGSTVEVNSQKVNVNKDGTFSFDEQLANGENKLSLVASKNKKTTTIEKTIVRQDTEQSVAGANTSPTPEQSENLNQSGPAENIWGITGLCFILLSLVYYFEQKKKYRLGL